MSLGMDGERQLLSAQRERALMPSHLASPWNYAVSYLDMLYRDQVARVRLWLLLEIG
jgi:hypothetical protein